MVLGFHPASANVRLQELFTEDLHTATPHYAFFTHYSVWTLPVSLVVTNGISCWFLFLPLLRHFSSGRSLSWFVPSYDTFASALPFGYTGNFFLQTFRQFCCLSHPSSAPKPSHPLYSLVVQYFLAILLSHSYPVRLGARMDLPVIETRLPHCRWGGLPLSHKSIFRRCSICWFPNRNLV